MNTSIHRRLIPFLVLAIASLVPFAARAAGDARLRLETLVDGQPLAEHWHDGTTYVEALRGREYSLRITNLESCRVAVAVSVDGRNVIDAQHGSAADASKWILGPWQSIVLDGWQISGAQARRFFFTTEERSYAEWLGDASNAGVVEAVAFREQRPSWWSSFRPGVSEREESDARDSSTGSDDRRGASSGAPSSSRANNPADSAQRKSSAGELSARTRSEAMTQSHSQPQPSTEAAATGIGRELDHGVVHVEFEHESRPSSSARIRYGFRDELVQLGVLPPPHRVNPWQRREQARGFEPGSYCPVPNR